MRVLESQETLLVSSFNQVKVMDQSEEHDAKKPARPQQEQSPSTQQPPEWSPAEALRNQQYTQQYTQQPGQPYADPYQQPQQQHQQQAPPPQQALYPQQPYPPAAAAAAYPPQQYAAQQIYYQQQQQQALAAAVAPPYQQMHPQPPPPHHHPYIQPKVGRLPGDRPLMKLSVSLIDTYKHINTVYYEERDARRAARAKEKANKGHGATNNGWDDENYDYIITPGEIFHGRYKVIERIGKGSFGQVVRAEDMQSKREVAIKIIKSKKPFLIQAKTEIELLTHLFEKDPKGEHNLGTSYFLYSFEYLVFRLLTPLFLSLSLLSLTFAL
jgi:hypothetical protein